jgi:hypothetical protein
LTIAAIIQQPLLWKNCVVCDLKDFDFFDLRFVVESKNVTEIFNFCFAGIGNNNVMTIPKGWTALRMSIGNRMPVASLWHSTQISLQGRCGILDREKKTLLTVIHLLTVFSIAKILVDCVPES